MSVKAWEKYQPNASSPSPQYPYGSLRQETALGVGDGTPLDVEWGNDFEAFKQTAFSRSGLVPSGNTDTVTNSEMFNAMQDSTTRSLWERSAAESGYKLVDGSFEEGGTLVNTNDVLWSKKLNKIFSGPAGPVSAGTNPATSGGVGVGAWADKSEVYGQISFNTVTDMLSSGLLHVGQKAMTLAYNQPVIQHWEVVASGTALITDAYPASDLTLKTQSGLWVKNVSDNLDQRHFGTYGDVNEITKVGTPDTDAIRAYAAYIKANKISSMNFSAGKVFFGLAGNNEIDLTGLDFDLNITGKFLATRFIRGNGAVTSRYARLFTIENEPGTTISVNIDGFYVDDNAAGNPPEWFKPIRIPRRSRIRCVPAGISGHRYLLLCKHQRKRHNRRSVQL